MKHRSILIAGCVGLVLSVSALAQAVVNGEVWMRSSDQERHSFIAGATSMIAAEEAYAKRHGTPRPVAGELINQQAGDLTVDQISKRITKWYEANPDRRKAPVMAVVWREIVKPGLAGSTGATPIKEEP